MLPLIRLRDVWIPFQTKSKAFFNNPKRLKVEQALQKFISGYAMENAPSALWSVNTTAVEGSHSRRQKFMNKKKYYARSFVSRALLSVLLENWTYKQVAKWLWDSQCVQ